MSLGNTPEFEAAQLREARSPARATPVSEDVCKLALKWKTRYCEHFNGAYCEICTAQDLADALREERRKALEEAIGHAPATYDDVVAGCDCGWVCKTSGFDPAEFFREWQGHVRALAAREGAGK